MLTERVMKPMEEAGDSLLLSFNFRRYLGEVDRIARESLHDSSVVDVAELARSMRPLSGFLTKIPPVGKPYVSAVASAYMSLCREARGREWSYPAHCRSVDQDIEIGQELASLKDWKSLDSRPSRDEMSRMVTTMSRLLLSYDLRVRYLAGLACITAGHGDDVRWLVRRTTHHLEGIVRPSAEGSWLGLVLGDEYICVREAISRHRHRLEPEKGTLTFRRGQSSRRSYWTRTYSYAEFAAMVFHAAMWECAWVLGRTLEKVELEVYLRTAP